MDMDIRMKPYSDCIEKDIHLKVLLFSMELPQLHINIYRHSPSILQVWKWWTWNWGQDTIVNMHSFFTFSIDNLSFHCWKVQSTCVCWHVHTVQMGNKSIHLYTCLDCVLMSLSVKLRQIQQMNLPFQDLQCTFSRSLSLSVSLHIDGSKINIQ